MSSDEHFSPRDWASHPPFAHADYRSTALRAPSQAPVAIGQTQSEKTGPQFSEKNLGALHNDLTANARSTASVLGERIIVSGRLLDEQERPIRRSLIEIWQANAAGRYVHSADQHDAPLDPNFLGAGRCLTDDDGWYRFVTIKPGAYPWGNHHNAWRPAHIHFSLFGESIMTRLVTQMYFPGDPLFAYDPIFNSVSDAAAQERLVAEFSLDLTEPETALGYRFDIVLRGRQETPLETRA